MTLRYSKIYLFTIPLLTILYSCSFTQDQTLVTNIGVDSIKITTQRVVNDFLTYDKFYYDKLGDLIENTKLDIDKNKDTIEIANWKYGRGFEEFVIKTKNYQITRRYTPFKVKTDIVHQKIFTTYQSINNNYTTRQEMKIEKLDQFVSTTHIYPVLPIDSFSSKRTYTFNNLVSREQFFDPENEQIQREVIYKYDTYGNVLSKAIKEKNNPRVYTYSYKEYYKDGRWKTRSEYLNKELISTQTQDIFYNKKN